MTIQELVSCIRQAETAGDLDLIETLIRAQPGSMAREVQDALLAKLREVTQQSRDMVDQARTALHAHGVNIDLGEWLTPANYAEKFRLGSGKVVTNWIARGIIPADCVKEIPELGLRLVKAIEYEPRPYKGSKDAPA